MISARPIVAPWPVQTIRPVLVAGAMAGALTLAAGNFGVLDMPFMAGCGPGMMQASLVMALRMAVGMTVIGIMTARPRLICSGQGALTLAAWVLGLMVFAVVDQQTTMAGLAIHDPVAGQLLRAGPLLVGLLAAALAPRGHKACIATMIVMTHAGLMTWPWMAGCAALTAWTDARRGRECGLRRSQSHSLSV